MRNTAIGSATLFLFRAVSHQVRFVRQVADRVILMDRAKSMGKTHRELFMIPQHPRPHLIPEPESSRTCSLVQHGSRLAPAQVYAISGPTLMVRRPPTGESEAIGSRGWKAIGRNANKIAAK